MEKFDFAKYIVKCVNSHSELLEACKRVKWLIEDIKDKTDLKNLKIIFLIY